MAEDIDGFDPLICLGRLSCPRSVICWGSFRRGGLRFRSKVSLGEGPILLKAGLRLEGRMSRAKAGLYVLSRFEATWAAVAKVSEGNQKAELGWAPSFSCFEKTARAAPRKARDSDRRLVPRKADSETEAGKIDRPSGDEYPRWCSRGRVSYRAGQEKRPCRRNLWISGARSSHSLWLLRCSRGESALPNGDEFVLCCRVNPSVTDLFFKRQLGRLVFKPHITCLLH